MFRPFPRPLSAICAVLVAGLSVAVVPARAQQPTAAPASPSANPPASTPQSDAEIIRDGQGSLVFVEGTHGAGSGFICTMGNQKYLFTNAHVMAGNIPVTLTLLDGSPIRIGAAGAAVGHDIVRFVVPPAQPAFSLPEHVNDTVLVGDEVLVLGNAKGARVINPIAGKVVGIGPDLVEVDAPFQPGNSGSPIIQKKSGRVVGIATYVKEDKDDLENQPSRLSPGPDTSPSTERPHLRKLRRFGYRLDSVKVWQDVAWPEFQGEAAALDKVDERTDDILAFVRAVAAQRGTVPAGAHHTAPVDRIVNAFFQAIAGRPSPTDLLKARQDLLDGLRRVCQSDMTEVRPKLRYDYFARELTERQRFRDELSRMFETAFKAQTNTTGR